MSKIVGSPLTIDAIGCISKSAYACLQARNQARNGDRRRRHEKDSTALSLISMVKSKIRAMLVICNIGYLKVEAQNMYFMEHSHV